MTYLPNVSLWILALPMAKNWIQALKVTLRFIHASAKTWWTSSSLALMCQMHYNALWVPNTTQHVSVFITSANLLSLLSQMSRSTTSSISGCKLWSCNDVKHYNWLPISQTWKDMVVHGTLCRHESILGRHSATVWSWCTSAARISSIWCISDYREKIYPEITPWNDGI